MTKGDIVKLKTEAFISHVLCIVDGPVSAEEIVDAFSPDFKRIDEELHRNLFHVHTVGQHTCKLHMIKAEKDLEIICSLNLN